MQSPGLYIHIPFCKTKCPYCGFYSIAFPSLIPRWLDAIKKEVLGYKDRFGCFDTLYFGGGTPTVLEIKDLETIMRQLFSFFSFERDTEITIEANPADLTREKAYDIKTLGCNRVNLGVQSFDNRDLLFLGRNHTAEDSMRALENLRTSGFRNVGMDLMYGFEGQTLKGWMRTLKQALACGPEHLSCYQLTFEKKTLFWKMRDRGELHSISGEKEKDFFLFTSQFLEDNGYVHYEISNFAKETSFYSRHNWKYWAHAPYLGLGPSSHSYHNATRWWNVSSIKRYCEALETQKLPVEASEELTQEQLRLESIALGLRTRQGFRLEKTAHDPALHNTLTWLRDSGFLRIMNGKVVPTRKGFLVADHLPLYVCT